ncbi:Lachrymatory-factor synthase [Acorus calamus]|uniref:Lachrymatory-factor synthase n=1 Tax=Acorus calamus TaxID=4465 RepID=A0AAV9EQE1_ACOCL|nr:Lachrymatory-factor synthase [Acorus calamus]
MTTATLTNTTADQAWSLMKNFTGLDKILPAVQTCYKVEGVDGEPSCIRYAAGKVPAPGGEELFLWAKERLIETNLVNQFFWYEMVESSVGFRRYFRRLGAKEGGGGSGGGGGDQGWTKEEFDGFLGGGLEAMARRIEEIFKG